MSTAQADAITIVKGTQDDSREQLYLQLQRLFTIPVLLIALYLQVFIAPHPWGWNPQVAASCALATQALNDTRTDEEALPGILNAIQAKSGQINKHLYSLIEPDYRTELISMTLFNSEQAEIQANLVMKSASYLLNRSKTSAEWMKKGMYQAYRSTGGNTSLYLKLPLQLEIQKDSYLPIWKLADLRQAFTQEPQFVSFWTPPTWEGKTVVQQVKFTRLTALTIQLAESQKVWAALLVMFGLGASLCLVSKYRWVRHGGFLVAILASTLAMCVGPYLAWVFTL